MCKVIRFKLYVSWKLEQPPPPPSVFGFGGFLHASACAFFYRLVESASVSFLRSSSSSNTAALCTSVYMYARELCKECV